MDKDGCYTKIVFFVALLGIFIVIAEAKGGGGVKDGDGISVIPAPDEKTFNLADYDATGDGETDDVEAFMGAFRAACDHPGKARFLIPRGQFVVSQAVFAGPCKGPGPIVVQITGNVKAIPDISMYPEPEWLIFERINGLVIFGGGTIDGQGAQMWKYADCNQNSNCARLPSVSKL
ncbi:exopolygalacturonase-like [Chenopodium quinoa]|uniref:exopolygalacturonase-like n=1 Tax=Chenopodium quinoa TaxID=63459 RepID=UPI000B78AFA4|nr:exopolygalacturonase-like [Chenopodium quinoa]